jgi:ABC-type antimicrobial peptide transport system permease subunit
MRRLTRILRLLFTKRHIEAELAAGVKRINALVAAVFGAFGLVLAAVGVYSVIAYSVSQRTQELGVRMAVGARPSDLRALVLREGLVWAASGIFLGFAMATVLVRYLETLLFGVKPFDPLVHAGVALLLTAAAVAASWRPASRAARGSVLDALRIE